MMGPGLKACETKWVTVIGRKIEIHFEYVPIKLLHSFFCIGFRK